MYNRGCHHKHNTFVKASLFDNMKQYFVLDVDLGFNNNKETVSFVLVLSAKS